MPKFTVATGMIHREVEANNPASAANLALAHHILDNVGENPAGPVPLPIGLLYRVNFDGVNHYGWTRSLLQAVIAQAPDKDFESINALATTLQAEEIGLPPIERMDDKLRFVLAGTPYRRPSDDDKPYQVVFHDSTHDVVATSDSDALANVLTDWFLRKSYDLGVGKKVTIILTPITKFVQGGQIRYRWTDEVLYEALEETPFHETIGKMLAKICDEIKENKESLPPLDEMTDEEREALCFLNPDDLSPEERAQL